MPAVQPAEQCRDAPAWLVAAHEEGVVPAAGASTVSFADEEKIVSIPSVRRTAADVVADCQKLLRVAR